MRNVWLIARVIIVASIILVLISSFLHYSDILLIYDDAYIFFRYAKNYANGYGLVYNIGERVEGYTSFLWVYLLGLGYKYLRIEPVNLSVVLGVLSYMLILGILYRFSDKFITHKSNFILIPILLYAADGSFTRYVFSGMDTLLFVALFLIAIYVLIFIRHPLQVAIAFFFLALSRPEGLAYLGLGLIFVLVSEKNKYDGLKRAFQIIAIFFALYAPYFIWRYVYYGYLLPNTYYAKASALSLMKAKRGFELLVQVISWTNFWLYAILSVFLIIKKRSSDIYLFFLILLCFSIVYFVIIGGDFIVWFGPRFLMPILPLLYLLSSIFLFELYKSIRLFIGRGLILGITIFIIILRLSSYPNSIDLSGYKSQMNSWIHLAIYIRDHTPEDILLATDAAGIIPYYSGRSSIDMFGLTDAHIAHLPLDKRSIGVVAHEKFSPMYIISREPDCIVSTWINEEGIPISAGLEKLRDEISKSYHLVAVAKVRFGAPDNGKWVIPVNNYSKKLYDRGYQTGLFCKAGVIRSKTNH